MDRKDGKKKESIDEILSDLNGLLNKMPSILDGIKMPEIKPVEFPRPAPAPAPEPVNKNIPPAQDADKTIILESLSGLPEGAALPEEKPAQPAPAAGDKPMIIESFASLPEGAAAPSDEKLVPQSLGDFMFGEGAHEPAPEPAAQPEVKTSGEGENEPPAAGFPPQASEPAVELSPSATEEQAKPAASLAAPHAYETTRDFGIPDIDALMQLSEGDIQALTEVDTPAEPKPAPDKGEPSMDELAEFEKQLKAAVPQGEAMENKPEEEKQEAQPAPEAAQEPAAQPETAEPILKAEESFEAFTIKPQEQPAPEAAQEPAAQPETAEPILKAEESFEAFTIKPQEQPAPEAAQEPAAQPVPEAATTAGAEPEGFVFEPAVKAADAGISLELEARPAPEAAEALQLEQPGMIGAAPQESAPAAGGIELSIGSQPGNAQPFGIPASASKAEETLPGLAFEPASAAVSGGPASSGDETLVVPPPAGDEDKTVIFEAGSAPGATSRSQAGDLAGLAEKAVPEGIPAERVRALAFLYSAEDKALCATVLSELDAICLKSATKPMFVKRVSVGECASDANANYILQTVTDSGAQGLVCVGAIPQEKIYEIENAFTSSGGFFRHYDSAGFSHSVALDLVSDLILR